MTHFELHLKGRELPELAARLRALVAAAVDECPLCGLSRNAVRDMFREPIESDNYQIALHVRDNCRECFKAIDLEGGRK